MKIYSSVFENNGKIPSKYTCDGEGINPSLEINDIPENAKSLAFIIEDPDAPVGLWIHWMIWNIQPVELKIGENDTPQGIIGKNSSGNNCFDDICPPDREHRYFFKVFALDCEIDLDPNIATREDFYKALEGHIVESCELMGRYKRVI